MKSFGSRHHIRNISIVFKGEFRKAPEEEAAEDYTTAMRRLFSAFAQTFSAAEAVSLDFYQSLGRPNIGMLEPFSNCGGLTELTVAGFELFELAELNVLLSACPKLLKLEMYGAFRILERYEHGREFLEAVDADNDPDYDIARNEYLPDAGFNLEWLAIIKDHLPHLKELGISPSACPTAKLEQALWPFEKLESLTFFGAFHNFKVTGFNHQEAARYVSSFLPTNGNFVFPEDRSLQDELGDQMAFEEEEEEGDEWVDYCREYDGFVQMFEGMVKACVGARLDENARIAKRAATGAAPKMEGSG